MSGLALPRMQPTSLRPTPRPPGLERVRCPAVAPLHSEVARTPPVIRARRAGPLAMSLLGHAAVVATGVVATLLLPAAPPAPTMNPPAFSVELAFAPAPKAPAPIVLADAVPMPQPPPDAVVVPHSADMAAALPAPQAPPAPVAVPDAADMAAVLPAPQPPPPPVAVPRAADMAMALPVPEAPPEPTLASPPLPLPPPVPPHPELRAHPPAARQAAARPAPASPAAVQPPAVTEPAAAPAPAVESVPMLIASPRFRVPPRPPVYPRRAIELRAQGEALIGALLDPAGTPHDVRVLRSSGHPMLDRAALDAVGGWAFEPGRRAGRAVAARVEIPVRFTLR